LFHPNTQNCPSVMQCLRCLASILGSRNKIASIDNHKMQYLLPLHNADVYFDLPPSCVSTSTSKNTRDNMDKFFNGHTWYHIITSNIYNSQGLTFRKSLMLSNRIVTTKIVTSCPNHPSGMKLSGLIKTNTPFNLRHSLPLDSTLVC
jgi:hypothetical protein